MCTLNDREPRPRRESHPCAESRAAPTPRLEPRHARAESHATPRASSRDSPRPRLEPRPTPSRRAPSCRAPSRHATSCCAPSRRATPSRRAQPVAPRPVVQRPVVPCPDHPDKRMQAGLGWPAQRKRKKVSNKQSGLPGCRTKHELSIGVRVCAHAFRFPARHLS